MVSERGGGGGGGDAGREGQQQRRAGGWGVSLLPPNPPTHPPTPLPPASLHPPSRRADPLRVLRAVRFASRFDFRLDKQLLAAASDPEARALCGVAWRVRRPSLRASFAARALAPSLCRPPHPTTTPPPPPPQHLSHRHRPPTATGPPPPPAPHPPPPPTPHTHAPLSSGHLSVGAQGQQRAHRHRAGGDGAR